MQVQPTKSEIDTCAFFSSINVDLKRISESKVLNEKSPDYFFTSNDVRIIVEVKQLEENDQELEVADSINDGKLVAYDQSNCSQRIRDKIKKTNRQLKRHCDSSNPGVLILQDVRPFFTRNFWLGHSIQEAMFGARTNWRTFPTHLNGYRSRTVADVFSHTGRATRYDKNQYVSCIGVLSADEDSRRSKLTFYHNPYAFFPLPTTYISNLRVRHYEIADPFGSYEDWRLL